MRFYLNYIAIILFCNLLICSCNHQSISENEENVIAKTPVEICNLQKGSINDEIILSGNSTYLKRNIISAPIPAFIKSVQVKLGDMVKKGTVLYVLQSKESKALENGSVALDSNLNGMGIITVSATANGIISTLDKQQTGDYVLEGMQLCTIAEGSELAILVNVPFEYSHYIANGVNCTIGLPDNTEHEAVFTRPLSSMNFAAQTQTIMAKLIEPFNLPENLIVKVSIKINKGSNKQLFPKICVLTDEMMHEFWVMKLINDTCAIKIPVTIGSKNKTLVEINNPVFNNNDRFIGVGNYGMSDTAMITIKTKE